MTNHATLAAVNTTGRQLMPIAPSIPAPNNFGCPEGQLRGIHLLQDHCCSYGEQIGASDVLEVDFDQRVIYDGLYIIAYPETVAGCSWFGARMFQRLPLQGLQIFEGDRWVKIHDGHRGMQVVGRILNVYRRTR